MPWEFNRTEAVFIQIAKRLEREILSGQYAPDGQLPSVRQLAAEASVNPNTVQKALQHLEEEGLLYTKGTVGRFVTPDATVIERMRDRLRRETIRSWLAQLHELDISTDELIQFIKEEEKLHEHNRTDL